MMRILVAAVLVVTASGFLSSGPTMLLAHSARPGVRVGLRIQTGPTMTLAAAHSNIAEWVVANGGYVHPAVSTVDRADAGVGLTLSAPVKAGQVLVALPPRLQVTLERLTGDDAAAAEMEVPPKKWDVKLALALVSLMHEDAKAPNKEDVSKLAKAGGFAAPAPVSTKSSAVDWATYVETLPKALNSLPIFYTGAQLREFEAEFPKLTGEVGGRVQLLKSVSSALPKDGAFQGIHKSNCLDSLRAVR